MSQELTSTLIQRRTQYVDEHISDIESIPLRKVLENTFVDAFLQGVSFEQAPTTETVKRVIELCEEYFWGIGVDKSDINSPLEYVLKHYYNDGNNIV